MNFADMPQFMQQNQQQPQNSVDPQNNPAENVPDVFGEAKPESSGTPDLSWLDAYKKVDHNEASKKFSDNVSLGSLADQGVTAEALEKQLKVPDEIMALAETNPAEFQRKFAAFNAKIALNLQNQAQKHSETRLNETQNSALENRNFASSVNTAVSKSFAGVKNPAIRTAMAQEIKNLRHAFPDESPEDIATKLEYILENNYGLARNSEMVSSEPENDQEVTIEQFLGA